MIGMANKLTQKDYQDAAREIGCSAAAVKAVSMVESGGRGGFDEKGRVLIRFEGHKFRLFTKSKFDKTNPKVSYAYHKSHKNCGNIHGYTAFNEAMKLDALAAMKSCSIGAWQPMVFNFHEMDYSSTEEMWSDFEKGERQQLMAFVRLIKNWGLDDELRRATLEDFANFAKRYNGADYKSNKYNTKMFAAFKKYSAEKPAKFKSEPVPDEVDAPAETDQNADVLINAPAPTPGDQGSQAAGVIVNNAPPAENKIPDNFVAEDKEVKAPPAEQLGKKTLITTVWTAITGGIIAFFKWAFNLDVTPIVPFLPYVFGIIGLLIVLIFIYKIISMIEKQKGLRQQAEFAADPAKNNVTFIAQPPKPTLTDELIGLAKTALSNNYTNSRFG